MGHVRDMDLELEISVLEAADQDGVVEIAGGFAVDSDDGQVTVVAALVRKMSGALALLSPDTTELVTLMLAERVVLTRAIPPPPVPVAVPEAVLPKMVLSSTKIDPPPPLIATAPPEVAAVF